MARTNSIAKKLIVYFLLLNVITVGLVSLYSYFRAKDALVKRTFDQLTSVRIEKTFRIEKFFSDLIEDLELLAKSYEITSILEQSSDHSIPSSSVPEIEQYKSALQKHLFSVSNYRHFFIVYENGNITSFQTPNISFEGVKIEHVNNPVVGLLWDKVKHNGELFIEDYRQRNADSSPAIYVGVPVFDSHGGLLGMLAIDIDMDAINSIMFDTNPLNGLGESGESYLVGHDHLMRSTSRFQDNSVFNTVVNTIAVERALNGETGRQIIEDYRGVNVLSSFSQLEFKSIRWAVLSEIDEEEAMIPIVSIRNNILYLSLLILLLSFALVYLIAKRISSPIVHLQKAAHQISEGEYNTIVTEKTSSDEIGSLVDAFNEMSSKIEQQTENIKNERMLRLSSVMDGQEQERLRLSRELHDGLGQSVLAVKMRLDRASNLPPEQAMNELNETSEIFSNIIHEVKSISNNLMPAALKEFGLAEALNHLGRDISTSTGIRVEVNAQNGSQTSIERVNTYLYRICQEALNNIVKHAESKSAILTLNSDSEYIYLQISDSGIGFDYLGDDLSCCNGLANMKERVQLLGGQIQIMSEKGKGTRIDIEIPVNQNS